MDTAQDLTAREYLRVSLDRSGRAKSVEEQHADHVAAAGQHGWTLGRPYADVNLSASRYARKARGDFAELLADLETDQFGAGVLILWESSRGSRQVSEWVRLIELCEQRQVRIFIFTHGRDYDPGNARDRRSLLEDAVDSEFESSKIRDRVRRSSDAAAKDGRPHGRLLYGYRREYDERGRYLRQLPHPEQAPVVREAAERVAAGESCYAIAQDFNARGIERPTQRGATSSGWSLASVKRVVMNASYCGLRVHRGQVAGAGDWEPIIPESLWRACVDRLTDPRRKTVRDAKVRHLLTGTARCDVCGLPMRVVKQRTGYLAYTDYPAFHVAIKRDWLDEFVTELVLQRMEREDAADLLVPADQEEAVAAAKRELEELEERLESFVAQAAAGGLTATALGGIEARLLPKIEDAQRRANPRSVPAAVRKLAGPKAREVWEGMDIALRRETVDLILDVRLRPTRRGERRFNPDRVRWEWKRS